MISSRLEVAMASFNGVEMQVDVGLMETSHSSRSSSDDCKLDNCSTSSDQKTAARSENEPSRLDQCKIEVAVDDNVIARKLDECGLGDVRVPELRLSGYNETASDDSDDDLCSASDDDEPYNPLASTGVMPPVLPVRLNPLICHTSKFRTLASI